MLAEDKILKFADHRVSGFGCQVSEKRLKKVWQRVQQVESSIEFFEILDLSQKP